MSDRNKLLEFFLDANIALLGAALVYWSKPIAMGLNKWAAGLYERFPKLKLLPRSEIAGTELNYKVLYIYFRVLGVFVLLSAIMFVMLFLRSINN
jgi:hypothetical protein